MMMPLDAVWKKYNDDYNENDGMLDTPHTLSLSMHMDVIKIDCMCRAT